MKKIAIINYDMSVFGGVESVASQLTNKLVKHYDVYLISLNNKNEQLAYQINDKVHYITISNFSGEQMSTTLKKAHKELRKVMKKENIKLALCMGQYVSFISIISLLFLNIKLIFCDHGALINQWDDKVMRFIRKFNTIFSRYTVVLTEQTKNDYIRLFKTRKNKITRIYNSIPSELIDNNKKYNIETNKIITAGRFTEEKGFDMLVDVARELNKIYGDWQWDVYGDGPEFEKIKQKVNQYGLSEKLFLKGKVSNCNELYKNYSMYVLPSYREGLPLVLLEAKASKLPIISFDIDTGPKEIVQKDINGFLIEKYNKKEMAIKIKELLENKELRKEFSDNAYNSIEKFDEKTIIQEWIQLIEKLEEKNE